MQIKYNSWDTLPIKVYKEICDVMKAEDLSDTERRMAICALLYDIDEDKLWNMDVPEAQMMLSTIDWVFTPREAKDRKSSIRNYNLNGSDYKIEVDVNKMTVAQYVDFQTITASGINVDNLTRALSIFFVPKGKKYNDGYDIAEVINNLESLPYAVAEDVCFFFIRQSEISILATRFYLAWTLRKLRRKMKRAKQWTPQMEKQYKDLDSIYGYRSLMK